MNFKYKIALENAGNIGNNIKLFAVSKIVYNFLENDTGLFSYISKKPSLFILVTDGYLELISLTDKKKKIIKTEYDLSICESFLAQIIGDMNNA